MKAASERLKLLLLPGMLNNETLWDRIAPALRQHADLVMPVFTQETRISEMADRALAMAGPGKVALVGFSMGGYVAQEILALAPDRVRGIALVDTQAGAADEATRVIMAKTASAARKDFEAVLARLKPSNVHPSRLDDDALMDHLQKMFLAIGADAFIRQCSAVAERPDRRELLADTRLPALIVCGRDDMICPPQRSQELSQLMPQAAVAWIDRCGHMSPLELPEAVCAALLRWIGEIA